MERNKPSKLTRILASTALSLASIFQIYSSNITPNDLNRDYMSDALIVNVPASHLGNALSMYVPGAPHSIYRPVPETFPEYERQKIPIDAHESGHGRGLINEKKTDDYAASKTGQTLRIPIIYPERRRAA